MSAKPVVALTDVPSSMIPKNLDAEQALLGAMLLNNRAYERVAGFLQPEHFADPANEKIYAAMAELIGAGRLADMATLKGRFERDSELQRIGGVGYLARLAGSAITVVNAEDYGRTILDAHMRRQLIGIGQQMIQEATTCDDRDALKQVDATEQALHQLLAGQHSDQGPASLGQILPSVVEKMERAWKGEVTALPTGFSVLDAQLAGGFEPGQLIVLAARPVMGKTALALGIALHICSKGGVAHFASLEMQRGELGRRILSAGLGIAPTAIKSPDRGDTEIIGRAVR